MHAWLVQRAVQHQEEVDSEKMMMLLRHQDDAFAAQLEDAKAEVEARIVVRFIQPPTRARPQSAVAKPWHPSCRGKPWHRSCRGKAAQRWIRGRKGYVSPVTWLSPLDQRAL